jgi:hypothetical protein
MTRELPPLNNTSDKPSRPELSAQPADKRLMIGLIVGFLLIIIIFIGVIYFLFTFSDASVTQTIRDISIILLALVNIFIGLILMTLVVVLAYLVLKINDLVQLITRETEPLLKTANDMAAQANSTVRNVQSKVVVVSDEAVKPVVNLLSIISAIRAIFRTLFRHNF